MKRQLMLIIDLFTFIFIVPFLIFSSIATGLVVTSVFDLDAHLLPNTEAATRPRIRRYVILPPVDPAPAAAEPAAAEVIMPIESASELPQVTAADVESASTDVQNNDEIVALISAPAENLAADEAPAETVEDSETPEASLPADSTTVPEAEPPVTTENPASDQAPAELAAAESTSPEIAEDTEETPVVSAPAEDTEQTENVAPPQDDPPVQTAPSEPAPVPDVSYFDKLLEQVKQ